MFSLSFCAALRIFFFFFFHIYSRFRLDRTNEETISKSKTEKSSFLFSLKRRQTSPSFVFFPSFFVKYQKSNIFIFSAFLLLLLFAPFFPCLSEVLTHKRISDSSYLLTDQRRGEALLLIPFFHIPYVFFIIYIFLLGFSVIKGRKKKKKRGF